MVQISGSDLAQLEPKLHKIFKSQLGFFEEEMLSNTLSMIYQGVGKEELENQLSDMLDVKKAAKLADEIWSFMEEYSLIKEESGEGTILGKRSRERTQEEDDYTESNKRKKYTEKYDRAAAYDKASLDRIQKPPEKKVKSENVEDESIPESNIKEEVIPPSPAQIQEMLKKTQQMIEERKKKLNVKVETSKSAQIAALQASIAAKLNKVVIPKVELPSKPVPLIIDDSGRTVDSTGQQILLSAHVPSLKANLRAQEKKVEYVKQERVEPKPEPEESSFQDPRIGQRGAMRYKRVMEFHEAGKFQAEAQRMRMKAQLEKLQSEISSIARKTGISSATQLAKLVPKGTMSEKEPDIEWWDQLVLGSNNYDDWKLREGAISNLIEHPIQLQPLESTKSVSVPMFLTKKEQKKMRRQNRREAWKEKQDKIRLGLVLPDEPKVKMSNLMRVLGNEQIMDPTKIEAHVRAQMAKRKAEHEQANAERKLTPGQKKEKNLRKLKEDTTAGVSVTVYRLKNLMNPSKKWKLEKNAQQLFMTGTVVLYQDINIVVVEGGPKQQKKYKQLMLNRIKWDEDLYKDKDGNEHQNECELVWEGQTKQRNFGEMKFKLCPTEGFARDHFKQAGVEHYWDQAYSTAVLASSGQL
ncbi:U4/U6 small nuclear ribonucleoprotein Prp3 [Eurytemora carolleeae]|uniref:U4/U6 small nuclear ribonucleoprotein Prp3 n=2 Tax=Eurytemora carolleeae TaxID=1294199 RepID=UPI000C75EC3A|nr:U4/U6 small nuclear ribonucleoprotein Prp3 [Eurytemora carolleeae]|eukprot:XP_023346110.1 U4/U6 small nuclear ribonucleoprotein Prp3-like [Eurytemora affinis]